MLTGTAEQQEQPPGHRFRRLRAEVRPATTSGLDAAARRSRPGRRGRPSVGRAVVRGPAQLGRAPVGSDAGLGQHLAHRPPRLEQRGEQQMLGRELGAALAGLLRGRLDEALGVGGVRQLLDRRRGAGPGGRPPSSRCRTRSASSPSRCKHRAAGPSGPSRASTMCSAPMASCSSRTASARASSSARCALGAQRVRIHARRGSFLAQSGFASSTSMMGMPSSTG